MFLNAASKFCFMSKRWIDASHYVVLDFEHQWDIRNLCCSQYSKQTFPDREIKSNIETSKDLFLFFEFEFAFVVG